LETESDGSCFKAAARDRGRESVRRRVEGDLSRRHDRLRDGDVRRAGESAASHGDPTRHNTAESARSPALQVELGGQAIGQAQSGGIGFATVVGVAAAMVILLISFGSFVAMGLPIATAALGLVAGIGLIGLASRVINMANFASDLALMIGLGARADHRLTKSCSSTAGPDCG
jgi:uncharacterized membrane protein YdfJ with MMPL/SSD domain